MPNSALMVGMLRVGVQLPPSAPIFFKQLVRLLQLLRDGRCLKLWRFCGGSRLAGLCQATHSGESALTLEPATG
jgi:hypothetical protein